MKKFLILFVLISISTNVFANEPIEKLSRGFVNIVTAPVEVPREIRAHWIAGSEKTYHVIVWILCGAVKGVVMTPARMASGVWDVVSFPFEIPAKYEPLKKPDFVFQDWPKRQAGVVYKNLGDK